MLHSNCSTASWDDVCIFWTTKQDFREGICRAGCVPQWILAWIKQVRIFLWKWILRKSCQLCSVVVACAWVWILCKGTSWLYCFFVWLGNSVTTCLSWIVCSAEYLQQFWDVFLIHLQQDLCFPSRVNDPILSFGTNWHSAGSINMRGWLALPGSAWLPGSDPSQCLALPGGLSLPGCLALAGSTWLRSAWLWVGSET